MVLTPSYDRDTFENNRDGGAPGRKTKVSKESFPCDASVGACARGKKVMFPLEMLKGGLWGRKGATHAG